MTLSNDATGLITLKINVTGLDVGDTDMYTFLNTDRNTDTGSASGCEYTLDVDSQAGSHDWVDDAMEWWRLAGPAAVIDDELQPHG